MASLMRAVAQLGLAYNVSVIDVPVPTILNATDVIVRINASAICGSDLHTYHQALGSPDAPYLYGHEAIGYVSEVGDAVQFLKVGDYVVIPDNVDNGHFTVEPDVYQVPLGSGGVQGGVARPGVQTEYVRVPFADNSLIPVPVNASTTESTLLDYLFISDIFATAWSGVSFSGFEPGDSVAVFGAGPVGLLAAYSAILRGASRVYSIDHVQSRLALAASIGAIPIDFAASDPVAQILALEPGGVRRSVEAVGYEAEDATGQVDASITLRQALNVTAPRGGIGIVGLFSPGLEGFDAGLAFEKTLTIEGGVVLPLQVASELVPLVRSGRATPSFIVSSVIGIEEAPEYYARFDRREETKVVIRF
ncbi:alcohol dehydrogenase [Boeremia exigua]|uniref:alcohol dehydrogenase n=1 Tax=Boeremia exigua TaxID=749465 RepID=UPI001E8E610A|nr:alcohol dehydrogenase [Boeremia exigua]KAH6616279.1 alcohol dehydrogenase [Boeremia exigua]